MKSTTRFLLRNLATADIGFLIIFVFDNTFATTIYTLPHYSSPQLDQLYRSYTGAPYHLFILNMFHVASIYSVVIVTGDRYIAICRPLQSGRLSTTRNARWAVAGVWLLSAIFNIPRGIGYMTIPCNNATTECYTSSMALYNDRVYRLVYHILDKIVKITIPLIALTIFNVKLIKAGRASREMHSETQRQQNNTTVMLVTIVITFIICSTPYVLEGVLKVIEDFGNDIDIWMIYLYTSVLSSMFLAVNSAVNFLIYLARGERFRIILVNICRSTRSL